MEAEIIQIKDEFLQKARTVFQTYNELYFLLGKLRFEKLSLQQRLSEIIMEEDEILNKFKENNKEEKSIVEDIDNEYGKGNLNLETGTYSKI